MRMFFARLRYAFTGCFKTLYLGSGDARFRNVMMVVMGDVAYERGKQDVKWGSDRTHLTDLYWLAIHGEEFGEIARAILDKEGDDRLREELIQLSATCAAHVQAIDVRRKRVQENLLPS